MARDGATIGAVTARRAGGQQAVPVPEPTVAAGGSPVFVVSTGRAGSSMLAQALAQHPGLLALHEPTPRLNAEAYASWRGSRPPKRIVAKLRRKRDDIVAQTQQNGLVYVESSHFCSHLIDYLADLYDARFIHLFRDGRDFVRSGLARPGWYPEGASASARARIRRWLRRRYLLGVGFEWEDHRLAPPRRLRSRLERITWLWVEINQSILDRLGRLPPTAAMAVRLESLNEDVLAQVLEFIGVQPMDGMLRRMMSIAGTRPNRSRYTLGPYDSWAAKDRERFREIAGPMMARLGY